MSIKSGLAIQNIIFRKEAFRIFYMVCTGFIFLSSYLCLAQDLPVSPSQPSQNKTVVKGPASQINPDSLKGEVSLASMTVPEKTKTVKRFDLRAYSHFVMSAYTLQDWDHFFGASQAYRKLWWKESPAPQLLLLEALGLIRFCRFSDAFVIVQGLEQWVRSRTPVDSNNLQRIEETKALIHALSEGKIDVRSEKENLSQSPDPEKSKVKSLSWPMVNTSQISLLPSDFLLKVVSKCE